MKMCGICLTEISGSNHCPRCQGTRPLLSVPEETSRHCSKCYSVVKNGVCPNGCNYAILNLTKEV